MLFHVDNVSEGLKIITTRNEIEYWLDFWNTILHFEYFDNKFCNTVS